MITSIINYVSNHWTDILAIYGAVVALATVVVKLTPTQKDDSVLAWVIKVVDYFSTVNPKK